MSGRSRRRILAAVKRGIELRFNADRAADVQAVIEFWIANGRSDNWQVVIEDGSCRVTEALEREQPDLTIEIDGVQFLRLVTGNATGPELFLKGDLKLDGDLLLASRLPRLFRRPRGGGG